ncbi:RagB/SusD family nutrient uptake outer membrane protein [Chitinophaga pendula]|uniref:RagB/SusD family nutrient uptake outer membrane protein n=1 Tax=Chitinophaga TaxID=79328 RepID=UPI000BAFAF9A|nr:MULTISPECIES: RagB/SusD family nutrient uptake outer membrane protein [Chitinophaga]ASZ13805.1 RagB/SusD family nutrient uptake outer membrane protein [Chitinophaga sp. MD30]UCJ08576.1 RagB/SusD family nutrient uptake outer membrane protein [Chitinophaga pendula]
MLYKSKKYRVGERLGILLLLVGSTLTMPGCKKYLEQVPDNRTELNSPDKVSQLLTSAYVKNDYITFCEALSDNSLDRGIPAGQYVGDVRVNENPYQFLDYASTSAGSSEVYWGACYEAIAAANQALEACNNAANPAAYAPYKGEALLARAYAHFMLVTFFSKPYDPATAANDPGIPYVNEPEKTLYKQYSRGTVAQVYDMIDKDIQTGLPLIDDKAYKLPAYRFNKAAANAFAARFYLFKKDYDKVITYAGNLGDLKSYLRPWNTVYARYTSAELSNVYTRATEKSNLLLAESNSLWNRGLNSYRFGMTSNIADTLFFRPNVTGGRWSNKYFYSIANPERVYTIKYAEQFVETGPGIGFAYVHIPLLEAEEVLFNRAEAYVMKADYSSALTDLNNYIATRITNYNPATHDLTLDKVKAFYGGLDEKQAMLKAILDIKRMEFVQEGIRWMDILRHRLPVTHIAPGGKKLELSANDNRKVIQIPQTAQAENIAPNPR